MPCHSPVFMQASKVARPCRQCYDCRQARKLELIARQVLEMQLWPTGYGLFITLTFENYWLPINGSADPAHLRDFFQNLRRSLARIGITTKFSYLYSCEYGKKNNRVHYHLNLFGLNRNVVYYALDDREQQHPIWLENIVQEAWGRGMAKVLELNASALQYVVKYVLKGLDHQSKPDNNYGRRHEFFRCSNFLGQRAIDMLADHYKTQPSIMAEIEHNKDVPPLLNGIMPNGKPLLLSGPLLRRLRLHFFSLEHVDQLNADATYEESLRVASLIWKRIVEAPLPEREIITPAQLHAEENYARHLQSKSRERLEREKAQT